MIIKLHVMMCFALFSSHNCIIIFNKCLLLQGSIRPRPVHYRGYSRGIGKAIAIKAARDGANIAIAAKTAEPHMKLPGTIYTAARKGNSTCVMLGNGVFVILIILL